MSVAAPTKRKRELTSDQRDRLNMLAIEEMAKPIDWFRHDSDANADPAVARLLVGPDGLAFYGLYWLLVEHLAARDRHIYSIRDDNDWAVLARDLTLYPRSQDDMALCHRFVETLADLGLIDAASYGSGYVESRRMTMNCQEVGMGRASKRLAGEITAQQRWGKEKS